MFIFMCLTGFTVAHLHICEDNRQTISLSLISVVGQKIIGPKEIKMKKTFGKVFSPPVDKRLSNGPRL